MHTDLVCVTSCMVCIGILCTSSLTSSVKLKEGGAEGVEVVGRDTLLEKLLCVPQPELSWLFCGQASAAQLSTQADGFNYIYLRLKTHSEGSRTGGSEVKGLRRQLQPPKHWVWVTQKKRETERIFNLSVSQEADGQWSPLTSETVSPNTKILAQLTNTPLCPFAGTAQKCRPRMCTCRQATYGIFPL